MSVPKIMLFDIESTALNATFGTILCIGWKFLGHKKVECPTILDFGKNMLNDKPVVEEFLEGYEKADYVVSWYGKRFDMPMIRSKMIAYGLPPMCAKPHLDLWETARRSFKSHSNRLQVWEQIVGTEVKKTPLLFDDWIRAAHGDKKALKYIKEHCVNDILVLEEVFNKMRPWIENEPARGLFTGDHSGCPSCGSSRVQKNGTRVAVTRTYTRYRCSDCGRWFQSVRATGTSPVRVVPS